LLDLFTKRKLRRPYTPEQAQKLLAQIEEEEKRMAALAAAGGDGSSGGSSGKEQ
jgi:hypothetical protein